MKAALIPPIPELAIFGNGDFHLLLSHLADIPAYKRHYMWQRSLGAYLVLDNSAHEFQAGERAEILARRAIEYDAQEVVVPDVLEDYPKTLEGCLSAMEVWVEGERFQELSPTLMYVPQGKDVSEWDTCLREMCQIHTFMAKQHFLKTNFCIGLSKDYEAWDGGLMRLIDEHLFPMRSAFEQKGVKMQLHLLGWGRKLWDLSHIAKKHTWIRSTDSAKPFVYALKQVALSLREAPPKYPTRPKSYFTRKMKPEQREIAAWNSVIFRTIAGGGH